MGYSMEQFFRRINCKGLIIIVSLLLTLLVACSNVNKKTSISESSQSKLIISTFSTENKGNILSLNINDNTEKPLVKDRQVGITGDLSADGSKVVYTDALGDSNPWQIYSCDVNDNQTSTITTDSLGKSHPKISDDGYIFFLTTSKDRTIKVGKINIEKGSPNIINVDDSDTEVDTFDVKNDKLIMSTDSAKLRLQKWNENDGKKIPIMHTVFEMDLNGNNLRKIAEIQASSVQSISYNYDCKKIIIGGRDINGDSGYGIYKLSLETGTLTTILTDTILANTENSIVAEIAHPALAVISKDENFIYFTGVCRDSERVKIAGLSSYPTAIFSYNISTKELKEVFNSINSSSIFDLNIKY